MTEAELLYAIKHDPMGENIFLEVGMAISYYTNDGNNEDVAYMLLDRVASILGWDECQLNGPDFMKCCTFVCERIGRMDVLPSIARVVL